MYRYLSLALVLLVAACGSGPSPSQQNLAFAATNSYAAAQTAALQYTSLPRCGAPTSPPLCSDAGTVGTIRAANAKGVVAVQALQKVMRDPAATSSAITEAIAAANAATSLLSSVTPAQGK